MVQLKLTINGFGREVLVQAHETLLFTLRERLALTGTKPGCEQGGCGSCTVLLDGRPVLACLTASVRCGGKDIVTIEGVEQNGELHPVQRQLVAKGAIQCGYCTPGIVMTALAFLRENRRPGENDIRAALAGNVCRCTGYAKIVEAVRAAAEEMAR